jgi:hypothetical protein
MPKIFLIKNRLHMQQQRLLESQKRMELVGGSETNSDGGEDGGVALTPPGSPFLPSEYADCEPLSLIVEKPANIKGKSCTAKLLYTDILHPLRERGHVIVSF